MINIEKRLRIGKENVNAINYVQLLLQEAYHLKLLTNSELENIQLQGMRLVAKQTERYTLGESSSVKVETAQNILQSIFYSIGIYLKSIPDTDLSIALLKQKPLSELYRLGTELIRVQVEGALQLLDAVEDQVIGTDNYAYNDTIQNAIPAFFAAYDVNFAAHDTPASIDYPLGLDKMDLVGIEYIDNYLTTLCLENKFCQNFSRYNIGCLLRGYDEHYQDLLINIFSLLLTNAVGCVLADKKAILLNINPFDREHLQQKLGRLSKDQLDILLNDAATVLCKELNIADILLQQYISAVVIRLSAKIKHALENNQLAAVFVSLKPTHAEPLIHFADGQQLDDELFRKIADEIRQCRYVSDKIAIIKRDLHSIIDLVDILEAYCMFDDEFDMLFQSLGDMELALLIKKLPTNVIDCNFHFTENEKEWQNRLNGFIQQLDLAKREYLNALAQKIHLN